MQQMFEFSHENGEKTYIGTQYNIGSAEYYARGKYC